MVFKNRLWMGVTLFLFAAFVLSACGPAGTQAPSNPSPTSPPPAQSPSASPTAAPTAAQPLEQYTNLDFGYSLSYPSGYTVQSPTYHTVEISAPRVTPDQYQTGRVSLSVETTLDQDAAWYANQALTENANLGIRITSAVSVIDSQQVYILGRLPGQDLSRQVYIVYKGILYHLTFTPDSPQEGEAYQQMEILYAAIMNSLHFLPDRRDVPPVTSMVNMTHLLEQAFESRSADEITRPVGDEFILADWAPNTPERVLYARYGRNEVAPLILSKYLSQSPALTLQHPITPAEWIRRTGSEDPIAPYFPDEVIKQVLVKGWGLQGTDEAVLIIARRNDNTFYWRGVFVAQGEFKR